MRAFFTSSSLKWRMIASIFFIALVPCSMDLFCELAVFADEVDLCYTGSREPGGVARRPLRVLSSETKSLVHGKDEARVAVSAHFWSIKALYFVFTLRTNREDQVAELEPNVGHDEPKDCD